MSVFSDSIGANVQTVLDAGWSIRDGQVVPKTDDVVLKNGAVRVEATYLYADLAGSSEAAHKLKKEVTGKIIRCYHDAASRMIRHYGGEIRSFDGDRVMGIFMGNAKNSNAANAGRAINWAVSEVIRPKLQAKWETLEQYYTIAHGVGIATGEALIVRGGVRDNNDLVSIGEAPNVAAKLSDLRGWPNLYITDEVYGFLNEEAKYSQGTDMWESYPAQWIGGTMYGVKSSTWWRRP